jgi:hypothetical protein
MLKFIKSLFNKTKITELEQENKELKDKLAKRQDVINETNAYWKKKLHALEAKKKRVKNPSHEL